MERRRSLKRKKEDDMSEQETRLPSVRARIAVIESRSRGREPEDAGKERKNLAVTEKRKRFSFPGNKQSTQDHDQQPLSFPAGQRTRQTVGTTDFEAHLQEVWSIRKNIHHKQCPIATNTGSKTSILQPAGGIVLTQADKYSRHGAIPAQQPHSSRDTTKSLSKKTDELSADIKRSPLQNHNTTVETLTPWNGRKPSNLGSFTYSETGNRHQSTTAALEMSSPKRKEHGETAGICREDLEPAVVQSRDHSDKVNYAKSMAKGYLRSIGSGEYTPQRNSYCKDPESSDDHGKVTKWKRMDSDEFDF